MPDFHPVQVLQTRDRKPGRARTEVTLRAYEVYCHVFGAQPAMVEGHCRGGFASSELIAFLYARSFPQSEWRQRVDEALEGLNV